PHSLSLSFSARPPTTLVRSFSSNDPATPELYTLSLHDALPIYPEALDLTTPEGLAGALRRASSYLCPCSAATLVRAVVRPLRGRSEEHTSELQSLTNLVCRLLLEKKKTNTTALLSPTGDSDTAA